jgi:hypothetical protein
MPLPTASFNPADSIFAGLCVIQLKLSPPLSGVTAATDTLTKTAHGLAVGQAVGYVSGTGFTGLTAGDTYYVVAVGSSDTFQLSATLGGEPISVGTSSAGVFQPVVVVEAGQLDDDPEQETKYLDRPDAKGRLRHVRAVETKANEKWSFTFDSVKTLPAIFGGALRGRKTGTATLWIPDPDDATGKVALKSEDDFACVVTRDGILTFGNSDFSKAKIKIESLKNGDIQWTRDAAA